MGALDATFGLPDPDDEHLVAAAVVGGAGAIVTHNAADLPADRLPAGIKVVAPAELAADTVGLDPLRALVAVQAIAARSGRLAPRLSVDDILKTLDSRYAMGEAVLMIVNSMR